MGDPGAAPGPLWRNRDFHKFWLAQSVSRLGTTASEFVVPVLALAVTGSAAVAGALVALQQLPYLVIGLLVGVLADRVSRKRIIVVGSLVQVVLAGFVAVTAWHRQLDLLQLGVVAVLIGTAFVFTDVADGAAFPSVVPREQLPRATFLAEGALSVAELGGPALGGLLLGWAATAEQGAGLVFGFDAATYCVAAVLIALVGRGLVPPPGDGGRRSPVAELRTGLRFLWRHPALRVLAISNFASIVLLAPVGLTIIVSATTRFGASATVAGLLFTVGGVGGLVGVAAMSLLQRHLTPVAMMVFACASWAAGMVVIASSPSVTWLVVGWAVISAMYPAYFSTLYAYRARLTPEALQGRVNSAYRILSQAGGPVGTLAGGWLLTRSGPQFTATVAAAAFVVNLVYVVMRAPRQR